MFKIIMSYELCVPRELVQVGVLEVDLAGVEEEGWGVRVEVVPLPSRVQHNVLGPTNLKIHG